MQYIAKAEQHDGCWKFFMYSTTKYVANENTSLVHILISKHFNHHRFSSYRRDQNFVFLMHVSSLLIWHLQSSHIHFLYPKNDLYAYLHQYMGTVKASGKFHINWFRLSHVDFDALREILQNIVFI